MYIYTSIIYDDFIYIYIYRNRWGGGDCRTDYYDHWRGTEWAAIVAPNRDDTGGGRNIRALTGIRIQAQPCESQEH